jgi:hypothetical protein
MPYDFPELGTLKLGTAKEKLNQLIPDIHSNSMMIKR